MAEYQMQSGNYAAAEKALAGNRYPVSSYQMKTVWIITAGWMIWPPTMIGWEESFRPYNTASRYLAFACMAKDTTSMEYIFFSDALTRELAVNSALSLGRLYPMWACTMKPDPCSLMPWMNHWPCMLIHLSEYAYALETMAGYQMDKGRL